MKPLNIVKIIDQWGWAYYFVDIEQQRYSRHNIIIQKYDNINLNGVDILYVHGPNIHPSVNNLLPVARSRDIKIIGGYGGELLNSPYSFVNALVTISPKAYNHFKDKHQFPTVFLPESIDTNYFVPEVKPNSKSFKVGYAGSTLPLKRTYLFDKLNFQVIKKCDWGKEFFVQKPQEDMKNFYKSIDALILLSTTECMPRVVLEAMAMGLPIIATNVGCLNMLLPKEWLVDVNPDEEVVKQVNEKLKYLSKHPKERKEIGLRNRLHVEKYFSWKVTQPLWDSFFEIIYNNNITALSTFPNYIDYFSNGVV